MPSVWAVEALSLAFLAALAALSTRGVSLSTLEASWASGGALAGNSTSVGSLTVSKVLSDDVKRSSILSLPMAPVKWKV